MMAYHQAVKHLVLVQASGDSNLFKTAYPPPSFIQKRRGDSLLTLFLRSFEKCASD
jgi:hypothetical protein